MINENKAGRKPKYSNELLINKINEYVESNPFEKLTIANLVKATGIPRHIWRDNETIQELINSLNNTSCIPKTNNKGLSLPSAEDLVNKHYGNKNKLIQDIQSLLDLVSDLYENATEGAKAKEIKQSYEHKIKELEETIKQKDNLINKLNTEIDQLYLDSENPIKRKELGLKDNLIQINPNNLKALSKDISDIEDEYSGLFD